MAAIESQSSANNPDERVPGAGLMFSDDVPVDKEVNADSHSPQEEYRHPEDDTNSGHEDVQACQEEAITPQVEASGHQEKSIGPQMKATGCQVEAISPQPEATVPKEPGHSALRSDLQDYIANNLNENTVKKTEQIYKRFLDYLTKCNINDEPCSMPPDILDCLIGNFLKNVKKPNGDNYEPDSLTSMHRAINRKLEQSGYAYDIVRDPQFRISKKALQTKRRELKQLGMGNRPNRSDALTSDQEKLLWERGQLGVEGSRQLLNTVWFWNTKLLGFRGSHESRQLKWGDIRLKADENGEEYLEFNERETKTRTGNSSHIRPFLPKIFPTPDQKGTPKDPVVAYKTYASKRPSLMLNPESPFYLAINYGSKTKSAIWYKCQPLGKETLGRMMSNMAKEAGIPGHITNHSLRRTMCTQLLNAGIAPTTVIQLSGHKNVQSLSNYYTADKAQQENMSHILQNAGIPSQAGILRQTQPQAGILRQTPCQADILRQTPPQVPSSRQIPPQGDFPRPIPTQTCSPRQTPPQAGFDQSHDSPNVTQAINSQVHNSLDFVNRTLFQGAHFHGTVNINIKM